MKTILMKDFEMDAYLDMRNKNYCKEMESSFRCFECKFDDCIRTDYMDSKLGCDNSNYELVV